MDFASEAVEKVCSSVHRAVNRMEYQRTKSYLYSEVRHSHTGVLLIRLTWSGGAGYEYTESGFACLNRKTAGPSRSRRFYAAS
jgi:hypothetical protein